MIAVLLFDVWMFVLLYVLRQISILVKRGDMAVGLYLKKAESFYRCDTCMHKSTLDMQDIAKSSLNDDATL